MPQIKSGDSTTTKSLNIFGRPLTIFGVPVDRDTIFSNHKGIYKPRIEKRQRKLIVKAAFIKFFLHHEERILCLTTGYSPITALEQMLTGLAFLFFKRAIFVFTDKRILHIPTSFDRSSNSAISQILYEDCAQIDFKGRHMVVKYKNGKEEQFPYIGRKERKKLKILLTKISLKPKAAGNLKERVYLCPSCTNILDTKANSCPTCKLKFKSTLQAKIRPIVIPGGGYFYSRHAVTGTVAGIVEIALLARIIYDGIALNQGMTVNILLLAGLVCALIGAKAIGVYHAHLLIRDFIPEQKDFAVRKI